MSLGISIVNYKTYDLTKNCIKSLLEPQWQEATNIWIVDNASNDGSLEKLKSDFPNLNYIESEKNLGFAGGHNLALKKMTDDYLLILNSDALVSPGSLDKMVAFMKKTDAGIAGCKVIDFEGKLAPSAGDFPFGQALMNWLFNLEVFGYYKPSFHRNDAEFYKEASEVDWISGNFMMIQKKVIDTIGLFDESFFMYIEDVEYCLRARKKGFKIMINPEVEVKHLSGGSADDPKFRQWSGELKNLVKLYKKEFGGIQAGIIKVLIYLATILRMMAFFLIGKFSVAKTYGKVLKTV